MLLQTSERAFFELQCVMRGCKQHFGKDTDKVSITHIFKASKRHVFKEADENSV